MTGSRNVRSADRRPPGQLRPAFTLIELMAALAISLLLIAAVMATLDVSSRLMTTGRSQVERQQLTRALVEQLTRDVQSVLFRPMEDSAAAPSGGTTSGDTGSGSSSSSTTTTIEDPADAYSSTSVGLIGSGNALILHISRPMRDLAYVPPLSATGMQNRTSDLVSVSYFLATPGAGGLSGAVGDLAQKRMGTPPTSESSTLGLARMEGDRMAIDHADLQLDLEAMAALAEIVAPEIVVLQFRYFDGAAWQASWDSTSTNSLPRAIEVNFGFTEPEPPRPRGARRRPTAATPTIHYVRHVVQLPMSEPAISQSEI